MGCWRLSVSSTLPLVRAALRAFGQPHAWSRCASVLRRVWPARWADCIRERYRTSAKRRMTYRESRRSATHCGAPRTENSAPGWPPGSPQLASAQLRASDRRPTPRLCHLRRAATQQAGRCPAPGTKGRAPGKIGVFGTRGGLATAPQLPSTSPIGSIGNIGLPQKRDNLNENGAAKNPNWTASPA